MAHPVVHVLTMALVGVAFVSGLATGVFGFHTKTTTVTRRVKVERSWGKPDTVVPGSQVNPAFNGLTCRIYTARKTVVCQP